MLLFINWFNVIVSVGYSVKIVMYLLFGLFIFFFVIIVVECEKVI